MSTTKFFINLIGRTIQGGNIRTCRFSTMLQDQMSNQINARSMASLEDRYPNEVASPYSGNDVSKHRIRGNISRKEKIKFLISTLPDIRDNKEAVYGALDAWVAWEQNFPIASLKVVLAVLEKEQQWHRVVQVIKWMLSKGQANTMGTYGQLLRALDKDHRAEEAHQFWVKKVGHDLHSVSWHLCNSMISIYYRNNMLERLVQLFRGLESFDRKPPEKSVIQKVANTYEILGLCDEKQRVLEKYDHLFSVTLKWRAKKSRKAATQKQEKQGLERPASQLHDLNLCRDGVQLLKKDIAKKQV